MKAYWDFVFENTPIKASGELFFDGIPRFIASSSLYNGECKILNTLMYSGLLNISIIGADGHTYCLYNCRIISITQRFSKSCIIADMTINFEMAIKQDSFDSKYKMCSFTFNHIEDLFPLESFDTILAKDDNKLTFQKEINDAPFYDIGEGISFKVESHLDGTYKSNKLYQLNITQTKQIYLSWDSECKIDSIISAIQKVKQYFEFIYHRQLHIKSVNLYENDFVNSA